MYRFIPVSEIITEWCHVSYSLLYTVQKCHCRHQASVEVLTPLRFLHAGWRHAVCWACVGHKVKLCNYPTTLTTDLIVICFLAVTLFLFIDPAFSFILLVCPPPLPRTFEPCVLSRSSVQSMRLYVRRRLSLCGRVSYRKQRRITVLKNLYINH
jgi:hypothetical protein